MMMENLEDKNPKDKNGDSALHYAVKMGHLDACKAIFELIEEKNPSNLAGNTPLHLAAKNGHLKICKYLVKNGVDKNRTNQLGQNPHSLATYSPLCYLKIRVARVSKFLNHRLFWMDIILLLIILLGFIGALILIFGFIFLFIYSMIIHI